jgi:hypothetical protein
MQRTRVFAKVARRAIRDKLSTAKDVLAPAPIVRRLPARQSVIERVP